MPENEQFTVVVSNQAAEQLVAHVAFLANVSGEAAERLVVAFEQAAASLKSSPRRFPWLNGEFIPANTYRYLIFEKRYLMIYQIRDTRVLVDYVADSRQDYPWLFWGEEN